MLVMLAMLVMLCAGDAIDAGGVPQTSQKKDDSDNNQNHHHNQNLQIQGSDRI